MIDNLLNILSVLVWGSIGFSLAFVLVRASSNAFCARKEAKTPPQPETTETLPQSETPVKTRKPRSKKQS